MNNSINKTLNTRSTESLFFRYKKISKKAVKIGGFLQISIHIFLGHAACFYKINSINFAKPDHGYLSASYSPKHFLLKALNNLLDLYLADSRIGYFWQVLESIHKFIIELHALQCLFVKRSNNKRRRGKIISSFTKGQTF